jgi:hypothetical protein
VTRQIHGVIHANTCKGQLYYKEDKQNSIKELIVDSMPCTDSTNYISKSQVLTLDTPQDNKFCDELINESPNMTLKNMI